MSGPLVLLTAALLAIAAAAFGDDGARLIIRAEPAVADIGPLPADRRLIRLPDLEFPLLIEPHCAADLRVESVSISVADTRRSYGARKFDTNMLLKTTIRVPRRQIGPLAVDRFCLADGDGENEHSARIPGAFTANVSLRCANDIRQSISYETLALEVRLLCKTAEGANTDSADDQVDDQESESPSSLTRF